MLDMKNQTAIVGVGRTRVDRERQPDYLLHIARALKAAVADAGLSREDIDGVMINMVPPEAAMDKLPEMIGLPNVSFAFQSWMHGRMQPTCIAIAAWAVLAGQANYVACVSTGQMLYGPQKIPGVQSDHESDREGGGPHLESPAYGMTSIGAGAAMAMRKYLLKYGGRPEDLGAIAVAQRQWAQLQPEAYFHGRPLTHEDYVKAPFVVEPLRVPDHCIAGNAAFCIIVTSAERAADCRRRPVHITGYQGSASGAEAFVFSRRGLGIGQQREAPYRAPEMPVYRMAGFGPAEIDLLGALDAFSPLVLFGLEEFGFCKEGEALAWVQNGRTAPGGELPVNVCGGGLSDIESFGWGHQIDMVRQLRGEAGAAQQRNVEVCQYISTDRSSLILTAT
jgi:acetyl-CoA acetyltransferase